jgi:hypothetical protein
VSTPYENVPQRIGTTERDAAVERLRVNLDEGRLDRPTYETRVASALAATTQDDLEPLFQDLPPVVSSTTYELYPHQSMATSAPAPYLDAAPYLEQGTSAEQQPPYRAPMEWFTSMPTWAKVILVVAFLTIMAGLLRFGGWWFIFFFPAVLARWGRNSSVRNNRYRQRRY